MSEFFQMLAQRERRAAQQSRAWEIGHVTLADASTGAVKMSLPGQSGTEVTDIPAAPGGKFPQADDQQLCLRIGGSLNALARVGRSPYQTGDPVSFP